MELAIPIALSALIESATFVVSARFVRGRPLKLIGASLTTIFALCVWNTLGVMHP